MLLKNKDQEDENSRILQKAKSKLTNEVQVNVEPPKLSKLDDQFFNIPT